MDKKSFAKVVLASVVVVAVGCDHSSSTSDLQPWADAIEGIYEVGTLTRNPTSCGAEGPSVLADDRDHMVVFRGKDIGGDWIKADGCADPGDCRQRLAAQRTGGAVRTTFSYELRQVGGGDLRGTWTTTGYSGRQDGVCVDATAATILLERPTVTQVRIEVRSVVLDHPSDAQGVCWTSDTRAAAAGKPCNLLDVVQGTRVEPL